MVMYDKDIASFRCCARAYKPFCTDKFRLMKKIYGLTMIPTKYLDSLVIFIFFIMFDEELPSSSTSTSPSYP